MIFWLFIALVPPFLYSLVNISDQYLVARYAIGERTSGGLILFVGFMGIFAALLIGIFTAGIFQVSILDKLLLIATGGITIIWVILYLSALKVEDVSTVVSRFLAIPIFGYVLGYIFLGERLSAQQQIGSLVVFIGVCLVSINYSQAKKKIKWKPAYYMLLVCFLVAVTGVIFKYVTVGNDFWVSSFWGYVGLGFFGILIFLFVPKYRREFIQMNREGGVKIFALNTISEILTIAGDLLTNYAILFVPVTLVYLVGSFQPAILLLLTLIATRFSPHIVRENMSKRVLVPKIIAIGIMIGGSILLFL